MGNVTSSKFEVRRHASRALPFLRSFLLLLLTLSLLTGCGGPAPGGSSGGSKGTADSAGPRELSGDEWLDPTDGGTPGEGFEAVFTGNPVEPSRELAAGVELDDTRLSQGYVGLAVRSDKRIVIQMIRDDNKYNYSVPADGSPFTLPLQFGNGSYKLRVMQNTTDNKFICLAETGLSVDLKDEFQPFLRSHLLVNYDENSACVRKAAELAAASGSRMDFVRAVYKYIRSNISYDTAFAQTVEEGYIPDPDRTFASGRGICFDFSSLAAAMLRSQGIPTKLITGYVGKDALYHAWNSIFLEEQGWISVEIKVDPENWNRIDMTYAATGGSGNGRYVDRYIY